MNIDLVATRTYFKMSMSILPVLDDLTQLLIAFFGLLKNPFRYKLQAQDVAIACNADGKYTELLQADPMSLTAGRVLLGKGED
jgi:hypothetical protein